MKWATNRNIRLSKGNVSPDEGANFSQRNQQRPSWRSGKGEAGWFVLLAFLCFRKKMRKYVINKGCLKRFVKQTQVI